MLLKAVPAVKLLVLLKLVGSTGTSKTRSSPATGAWLLAQLKRSVQKLVVPLPVQAAVAGTARSSRASSCGRGRVPLRDSGAGRPPRRNSRCHQVRDMKLLLWVVC